MAPKQRKSMLSRLSPRRSKKKEDYTSAVTQGSAEDPGTVGASSEEQIVVPDRGTQSAPTTPREADDEEPEPSTFGSAAAATAAAQGPKAEAPKLEVASLADVGASVAAADTAAAVATEAPAPPPRKSVSPPPKSSPRDDTPASAPPEGPPVKRSQSVSQEPAPPLQPAALARSKTDLREERASQGSPSFSTSVVSGVKSAVSGAVSTAKLAKHLTPAQIAKNGAFAHPRDCNLQPVRAVLLLSHSHPFAAKLRPVFRSPPQCVAVGPAYHRQEAQRRLSKKGQACRRCRPAHTVGGAPGYPRDRRRGLGGGAHGGAFSLLDLFCFSSRVCAFSPQQLRRPSCHPKVSSLQSPRALSPNHPVLSPPTTPCSPLQPPRALSPNHPVLSPPTTPCSLPQ